MSALSTLTYALGTKSLGYVGKRGLLSIAEPARLRYREIHPPKRLQLRSCQ